LGAKKNHSGSSERIKDFSVEKRNTSLSLTHGVRLTKPEQVPKR
jgi:hypothetical protein